MHHFAIPVKYKMLLFFELYWFVGQSNNIQQRPDKKPGVLAKKIVLWNITFYTVFQNYWEACFVTKR